MWYRLLADLLVLIHLGFILWIVAGGLVVWRYPRLWWFHIPAVLWGVLNELKGWICPLTPLENRLRTAAGEQGYSGGYIEHYLLPVVYPPGLTRTVQVLMAVSLVVLTLGVYAGIIGREIRKRSQALRCDD